MRALPAIVADADGEQRIADVWERELEAINRTAVEALGIAGPRELFP